MRTTRKALWQWCATIFAVASFWAAAGHAEELPTPLKPDAVIQYARTHRAEITAARSKAAADAEIPKRVRALSDPMVMVSIDHLPISLNGINVSVAVQQEFPLSGVLGARERVAEANAQASIAHVGTAKLNVEQQALLAYLMVVEKQGMALALDDQIATSKQIQAVTKARISVSPSAGADVLRTDLDTARLEGERAALDADIASAASMLEATLARPIQGKAPVCELVLPTSDPPSLKELIAKAFGNRPELASMKARAASAHAEVDVMESMYAPMAFVRAGGSRTMSDGPGIMLMVGLSLPIWREKLGAGVAEARAMVSMAKAEVSAMKTMIEGEVASARQAVIAARIRLATIRDQVLPLSTKVISLMVATYAAGQLPLISVLDAARAVREVRMQEVVAELNVAYSWVRLGRAIGIVKVGV